MRIVPLHTHMPRLNIYLPDPVYTLASRWRDSSNLSEICARAIKDELDAAEAHRNPDAISRVLRPASQIEQRLRKVFGLADAIVIDGEPDPTELRDQLGLAAARYLDRNISDGALIAVAGGRQMWCVIRNLSPRRVRTKITALGLHHADPVLLHVHPNTLATLLWLLYSPRSEAHVIGTGRTPDLWSAQLPQEPAPTYFVISSCSSFDMNSSFAHLLGEEATTVLRRAQTFGDFAYIFFDSAGKEIKIPFGEPSMRLPAPLMQYLSKRKDARTILVAGGQEKLDSMRITLQMRLCNTVVTDIESATRLLE